MTKKLIFVWCMCLSPLFTDIAHALPCYDTTVCESTGWTTCDKYGCVQQFSTSETCTCSKNGKIWIMPKNPVVCDARSSTYEPCYNNGSTLGNMPDRYFVDTNIGVGECSNRPDETQNTGFCRRRIMDEADMSYNCAAGYFNYRAGETNPYGLWDGACYVCPANAQNNCAKNADGKILCNAGYYVKLGTYKQYIDCAPCPNDENGNSVSSTGDVGISSCFMSGVISGSDTTGSYIASNCPYVP